jgi:hypothetical protein
VAKIGPRAVQRDQIINEGDRRHRQEKSCHSLMLH